MKHSSVRIGKRIAAILGKCNIAILTGLAILPLVAGAGILSDAEQGYASRSGVAMMATIATLDDAAIPDTFSTAMLAASLPCEPV